MRRLSLSVFLLALAGMLLAACDLRREQEVGEPGPDGSSSHEAPDRSAFIIYTHLEEDEVLRGGAEHLARSDIDGKNRTDIPLPDYCLNPLDIRLNPNGNVLALTCSKDETPLGLLNLDSLEFRLVSAGTWGAGQWSHDGERLAYLEKRTEPEPNRIHVVNVDGSDDRDYGAAPGELVGWTPEGRIVFGMIFDPCLDPQEPCDVRGELFDPSSGERTTIGNVRELGSWSPDGQRVLGLILMQAPERPPGTGWPFVTQLIDYGTDERDVVSFGGGFHVYPLAWMPDGKAFLVNVIEMTPSFTAAKCSVWWVSVADVGNRALIADDVCPIAQVSRDRQRIWFTSHPDPTEQIPGFQSELWLLDMSSGTRSMVIGNAFHYIVWEPPNEIVPESSSPQTSEPEPSQTPPPEPSQVPEPPTATPVSSSVATPMPVDSSTATPVAPVSPSPPLVSPTTAPPSSPD